MNIPLGKPYIKKEIVLKEIEKVLDRKWISGGPAIEEFENAIKKYNNDTDGHYIAIANATVALELILENISNRNGNGEIIVPSWSWVASGFVVSRAGFKPVWCDVNQYGVPDPFQVEQLITTNTTAIILVDQMGMPCDLDEFDKIQEKYPHITFIEDAACAFGSEYKGRKIGISNNHYVVYSFQARKCLTTGEGGMIRTKRNVDWLKSMRAFGTTISPLQRDTAKYLLKESFDKIGTNYKISDIQCALGLAHLQYFDEEIYLRTCAADRYNVAITRMEYEGYKVRRAFIKLPTYCSRYNWQNYHIVIDSCYNRDKVVDKLRKRGIGCKWDIQAIHLEPCYKYKYNNINLLVTEEFHNHGLWLPFFAEITSEQQEIVIQQLSEILKSNEVRI